MPTTARARTCRSPETRPFATIGPRSSELWNPAFKAWFEGPDDPNLNLVEVRIREAEYWDGPDSRIARLIGIVAAAMTGDEYDAGEQGEIELPAGASAR